MTYHINQIIFHSLRRATFINIKLYIEGRKVILSFTESCKWVLVELESLLMRVMHGLFDFESCRNSFAVIGSFAFSVPSGCSKKKGYINLG